MAEAAVARRLRDLLRPPHRGGAENPAWLGLPAKSTLLVTAVVLLLLAAVGWRQNEQLAHGFLELVRQQQDALAESVADDIGDKIELHLSVIEQTARRMQPQMVHDAAARQEFLRGCAPRALFDGVALIGLDGEVLANDPPLPQGTTVNVHDREYFQRLRADGAAVISQPLQSRSGQGPMVMMAAPVHDAQGQLVGALAGGLKLHGENLFGRLAQAPVGRTGHFELRTSGDAPLVLVHPDPALVMSAATQAPLASAGDIVTVKGVRRVNWDLHVVLPAWEAQAPSAEARRTLWQQLLGLGAVAALLCWFGMQRLLEPLGTLHKTMRSLREEPTMEPSLDISGCDERSGLAREFLALWRQLRRRQAEIAAVTEASPLGFFRVGHDGELNYANAAYLQIHGLQAGEAARGWLGLVRENQRADAWADWCRALAGGTAFNVDRRLQKADGRELVVQLRCAPLVVDGRLEGYVGTAADITERQAAERARRTLTAVIDATPDFVVQTDAQGRITYLNPSVRAALGIGADAPVNGLHFGDFNTAETNRRFNEEIVPVARRRGTWLGRTTVYTAGRREVPVSHMVIAHRGSTGHIEHFSAVMRDISAELDAQQVQQRQAATLHTVAESIPDSVAVVGTDLRYRFVNTPFERWIGKPREELVGRCVAEVLGEAALERSAPFMRRALEGQTVRFERSQGQRHFAVTYTPFRLGDGSIDGFVGVVHDISQHKIEEDRLLELSQRDALTGLLNRAGFEAHLSRRLAEGGGPGLALLYIDLDHFKPVNDTHGHPAGDELLRQFAQRLRDLVRPSDAVARLGGDEFAVVLSGVREVVHAQGVADKIIEAARTPFEVGELRLTIGASVGVAFGVEEGTGWQDLVSRADTMLYRAKSDGRGRHAGALH